MDFLFLNMTGVFEFVVNLVQIIQFMITGVQIESLGVNSLLMM